jgi:hypothetical protein
VPHELHAALEGSDIRSAEDLISFLRVSPSSVADGLGWKPEDVLGATEILVAQLRGLLDDEDLDPPRRFEHAFGAVR